MIRGAAAQLLSGTQHDSGRAPLLSLAASVRHQDQHRSTRWRVCTGTAVDGMHAVSMTRGLRGLISARPGSLRVGGLSPVLSPLAVKTRLKCPSGQVLAA